MIVGFRRFGALQTVGGSIATTRFDFAWIMIITVSVTTVGWLAVTLLTPPESNALW